MELAMRLTTRAILFCAVSSASFARAQDASRPAEPVKTEVTSRSPADGVDAFVQGLMKKRHIPGVSVAVVHDGRVVLEKGYGSANLELGVPATANTVYQLASVTKTFTA